MPFGLSRAAFVVVVPALASSGCGGTLGPLVTDVEYGPNGELIVTRCMLEISGTGNMTTYELNTCKRTVTQRPPSAARVGAASPPDGDAPAPMQSGATVVH